MEDENTLPDGPGKWPTLLNAPGTGESSGAATTEAATEGTVERTAELGEGKIAGPLQIFAVGCVLAVILIIIALLAAGLLTPM